MKNLTTTPEKLTAWSEGRGIQYSSIPGLSEFGGQGRYEGEVVKIVHAHSPNIWRYQFGPLNSCVPSMSSNCSKLKQEAAPNFPRENTKLLELEIFAADICRGFSADVTSGDFSKMPPTTIVPKSDLPSTKV